MADELKERLAKLREIAPRLNSATDQTSQMVASVERFLVEELHLGISAESSEFNSWYAGRDDDGNPRSVRQTLAFGRVGSGYRIHVVDSMGFRDDHGRWQELATRQQTPWPSCGREIKLRAVEKLPELLDTIVREAERLAETAGATALKIGEMIGESKGTTVNSSVASHFLTCPSCGETGKCTSLGSSRWGACEDCDVRWFIDTKGPVGGPEVARQVLTCSSCGEAATWLNVGSSHWAACRQCEVKWPIGANLLPSWRDEAEQDWKRNAALIASYSDAC
jgi:hypothetical protein